MVDRVDVQIRQRQPWVVGDDLGIVPFFDLAGENAAQILPCQLQAIRSDAGDIGDENDRGERQGKLIEIACRELFVRQRNLQDREIRIAGQDLARAGRAADPLIGDR